MSEVEEKRERWSVTSNVRVLADQAFSRAAGSPLVAGNSVRLLRDAAENYPAMLAAIRAARRVVHFESYIIHEDETGREFAEALAAKAREGVRVRLIYDWMGAFGAASGKFWRGMRAAGIEVRCFNPPHFGSPFGWLSRDHRKVLAVDGEVAFVTGLCVGKRWVGYPERNIEPWRDTGIEIKGPAVADVEQAFAQSWVAACGEPLPEDELPDATKIEPAGEMMLRVIASQPNTAGLYRLDHLIAALARKTLWLTDAYFIGTTPYVQALRAAAQDGVDVRLLVPGSSDVVVMSALSRAGYRSLLEAGVRVFEWNGTMLHAKTAVADGLWARVGSTNLNLASWIGNWELDVAVENKEFARAAEEMYLADLEHSTEIVLTEHKKRVRPTTRPEAPRRRRGSRRAKAGRAALGALGVGKELGAALTDHRVLGPAEARVMLSAGALLLGLVFVAVLYPRWITIPLATIGLWTALALFWRAYKLRAADAQARGERDRALRRAERMEREKIKQAG
ncbi:MAG: cardiolipin synthase [Acidobacteriota bacterium]|nr:cardiolipin synthase [Acidobacteriota bacterium]